MKINNDQHFTNVFDSLTIRLSCFLIEYESIDIKDLKVVDTMLKKCVKLYDTIAHVKMIMSHHPSIEPTEDIENLKILDSYIDYINKISMQCITQDRNVIYKSSVKAWLIKPTDTKINIINVPNLPSDEYAKIIGYECEEDIITTTQWCFSLENNPSTVYLVLHSKDDVYNKVATELLDKVKNQNCFSECKGTFLIIKQSHNADYNGANTMHPSSRFEDMDLDVKTFIKEFGDFALRQFMKNMKDDFTKMMFKTKRRKIKVE